MGACGARWAADESGSPGPVRNRFGAGHTLTLRVPADWPEQAAAFVTAEFPGAELREAHGGRLRFQLPPGGRCALARVFQELVAHGPDHGVEDFSVSQTTLEEVTAMPAGAEGCWGQFPGLTVLPAVPSLRPGIPILLQGPGERRR